MTIQLRAPEEARDDEQQVTLVPGFVVESGSSVTLSDDALPLFVADTNKMLFSDDRNTAKELIPPVKIAG